LRKNSPIGVKTLLGLCKRCVAVAGVLDIMLLNFGILKMILFLPTRSDQYRTFPTDVVFTTIAINTIGINKINNSTMEKTTSNNLFIIHNLGDLSWANNTLLCESS